MFEDVEKKAASPEEKPQEQQDKASTASSQEKEKKVEDIFSDLPEPKAAPEKEKTKENDLENLEKSLHRSNVKFYLKIGGIIIFFFVLCGIIFGAVFFGFSHFAGHKENKKAVTQNKFFQNSAKTATSTTKKYTASSKTQVKNQEKDSDHDGLSDAEERKLGTNPYKADTDGDGLTDYQEVKIYHTNPLNPDTDGDGYSDGEEVNHGYNPLGPGKLATTTNK